MKNKLLRNIIFFFVLFISCLIIFKVLSNNATFMYFYYLIVSTPEDLKKPIIRDDFNFNKKGLEKNYKLEFAYNGIYEVTICDKNEKIPIDYIFTGKIRLDFYYNGKIIHSQLLEKAARMMLSAESYNYFMAIVLYDFGIPLKGEKEGIELKVTVVEPDKKLSECCNDLELWIIVTSMI